MHLFDPATHFSCSGIIAEGYPPALGMAFAFQRRGTDRIAVAVTGEGAANQGAFHESLNLAALWRLPVVFVVEDNDWGISVPRDASTAIPSNADRAAAYGMPGERIEDNDVDAVWEAAGRAVARARGGDGPSLIEVRHGGALELQRDGQGHGDRRQVRVGDDRTAATATADRDEPLGLEHPERLAKGRARDAELHGEVLLDRQPLTLGQLAAEDARPQLVREDRVGLPSRSVSGHRKSVYDFTP